MKIFERITKRYALQNYYLRRNFYWPDTLPEILDYWQQHNDLPFLYGVDNWPYDVMCERQRRKGVYASQYLIPDRTARQMAALAVRYFDNDSRIVGAANLNLLLQQALNPSGPEFPVGRQGGIQPLPKARIAFQHGHVADGIGQGFRRTDQHADLFGARDAVAQQLC